MAADKPYAIVDVIVVLVMVEIGTGVRTGAECFDEATRSSGSDWRRGSWRGEGAGAGAVAVCVEIEDEYYWREELIKFGFGLLGIASCCRWGGERISLLACW